eukprot:scaffold135_cov249-Pinguiococcus_pyrenoidosus.AAC.16
MYVSQLRNGGWRSARRLPGSLRLRSSQRKFVAGPTCWTHASMRRLRRLPAASGQRRQLSASGDRAALLAFFAREFVILSGGASVLAMFVAFNAALLEFILEKRDEYEYDLPGELVETRNGMRHVATEALAGGPNDQSDPVVVFLADGDETTDHWTLVRGHLRQAGVASLAYDRAGRGYSEAAQHPSSKAQGTD